MRGGDWFRVWLWDVSSASGLGLRDSRVGGQICTDQKVKVQVDPVVCVRSSSHPPQVSRAIKISATHSGPLPVSYVKVRRKIWVNRVVSVSHCVCVDPGNKGTGQGRTKSTSKQFYLRTIACMLSFSCQKRK